jgi:hypothetical protein
METAEDNVVDNPTEEEPAGPVGVAKGKHPSDDREEADEEGPEHRIFERSFRTELLGVIGDADDSRGDEEAADGDDREGTLVHDRHRLPASWSFQTSHDNQDNTEGKDGTHPEQLAGMPEIISHGEEPRDADDDQRYSRNQPECGYVVAHFLNRRCHRELAVITGRAPSCAP